MVSIQAVPDPTTAILLWLAIVIIVAKAGGEVAVRAGQPAVLGELVAGLLLGNLPLIGVHALQPIGRDATISALAEIGVVLLLFEVGLESTVRQMAKVGLPSALVAIIGVGAPFALGWLVAAWFLPGGGGLPAAFVGAALSATSIGISARVLKDLGRAQSTDARIILGAAVLDDVLGLVLLAVVVGAAQASDAGRALSLAGVLVVVGKAAAFLVGALVVGVLVAGRMVGAAARLKAPGALLATGLGWCFLLAWLAHAIGLAPIVGAFAAGLVLEEDHYGAFHQRGEPGLEQLLAPVTSFLVPIFFVTTGMRTDLRALADGGTVLFAAALTAVAIAGKLLSSLGALGTGRGSTIDRLSIGVGMIPRGEVGLIFASVGRTLTLNGEPIVSETVYAAVVVMVAITTLVTPPLLVWRLRERRPARSAAAS
jgi:Kef-type K+ transport system membrane component KefB